MEIEKNKVYSYSIKYLFLYRGDQTEMIYNMIQPFTENQYLFNLLTESVIFIDVDSKPAFTNLMRTEFNKIQTLPALVDVIFNTVFTATNEISSLLQDLLDDLRNVCNQPWDTGFFNNEGTKNYSHCLTEKIHCKNQIDLTDQAGLQQYMNEYNDQNKKRDEIHISSSIPIYNGKHVQIKDDKIKEYKSSNTINYNDVKLKENTASNPMNTFNLNQMQLDLA